MQVVLSTRAIFLGQGATGKGEEQTQVGLNGYLSTRHVTLSFAHQNS